MSKSTISLLQLFKAFPDEESARVYFEAQRWPDGPVCPACGEAKRIWSNPKRAGFYRCNTDLLVFTVRTGTIFERSKVPLNKWLYAMYLLVTTRHGVPAKELQRQLGVTYKTAWRMAGLIREHMADVDGDGVLGGNWQSVEIDETYVGGVRKGGKRGRGADGKTVVLGMMDGDEVVTKVVTDVKRSTLLPHINAHVAKGSLINTDELKSYNSLPDHGFRHITVNHGAGQYVGTMGATVNGMEGFWSQLKRSINGTHIHVSGKHLWKYAKEAEYRFNRRDCASSMLPELLSTFRPLPPKCD